MQLLDRQYFTVHKETSSKDNIPRCRLIVGEQSTVVVEGITLEGCARYQSDYLVFLSDNCPFEERLHIYLFNEQLQQKDYATLGSMYTPGIFTRLRIMSANSVSFSFFSEDDVWEVTVLPTPRRRIPGFSDPRGIWRGFKWHCHFTIRNHQ